jgi:hypothetical protein
MLRQLSGGGAKSKSTNQRTGWSVWKGCILNDLVLYFYVGRLAPPMEPETWPVKELYSHLTPIPPSPRLLQQYFDPIGWSLTVGPAIVPWELSIEVTIGLWAICASTFLTEIRRPSEPWVIIMGMVNSRTLICTESTDLQRYIMKKKTQICVTLSFWKLKILNIVQKWS